MQATKHYFINYVAIKNSSVNLFCFLPKAYVPYLDWIFTEQDLKATQKRKTKQKTRIKRSERSGESHGRRRYENKLQLEMQEDGR